MAEINITRGLTLVYEWESGADEPQHVWLMFDASDGTINGINFGPHTTTPRIVKPAMRLWARDRILEHLADLADRTRSQS